MFPMRAGVEIPVETSGENVQCVAGCRIGGTLKRWARSGGKAGVATEGEADTIGVGKLVAEIAGEGAIEESVVLSLAIRLEVGTGGRVIKGAQKAADLRAAASAGKAAAFGKKIEGRGTRDSLMREKLDDARHGVATVKRALRAVDDLHFIDVIEGEVGETDESAGVVDRHAINENLCVIRVSAIEKEGGKAANGPRSRNTDSGLRVKKVGKSNALALADLLTRDFIDRCSGAAVFQRLSIGGDNDVFRDALNFETKVEGAILGSGEIKNGITGDEGPALEMNVIAAGRNGEEIGAVSAGNRRPDASVGVVFKLCGDFDVADAVAGKICEPSGKMRVRWIGLCLQGKAEYRNCDEKKGSTKKRRFHFILRSLS